MFQVTQFQVTELRFKSWSFISEVITIDYDTKHHALYTSESCMEQLTGSGLRKEHDKAVYHHLVYLTYMQSTSSEMLGWMSDKLESRLPGEITTSDMQMTPPLWQKVKKN